MNQERYISAQVQRVLKTLDCLFGHEINGLTPGQITQLAGCSAANTTADLANLIEAGFAEAIEGVGTYRITPRVGQKALAVLNALSAAQQRLDDTKSRFTRNPS
jgi:DNA-binding IclR family transcriptional regulator